MTLPITILGAGYLVGALAILACLLLSLVRVFRGPTPVERVLAAQLMGTAGVSVLLLLDAGLKQVGITGPALIDVALVFALLAGVAGIAFVYRGWEIRPETGMRGEEADGARD